MEQKNKTILDILLSSNRITDTEASQIPADFTNEKIEEKLRKQKMVSSEDIAKAYAVLYDLPIMRLENYLIKPDALKLIPKDLAQKYKVVVFEKDDSRVKMAFGLPAHLKSNPPQIISDLKHQKGITVDIYITTPEDIQSVLPLYDTQVTPPVVNHVDNQPKTPKQHLKTIDCKNIKISYETITKFPIEISKKYSMVVFENHENSKIKVAVSNPFDSKVQEILDFVRQKNEIEIEEYTASPEEIAEAIKLYYKKPVETPVPEVKKIEPIKPQPIVPLSQPQRAVQTIQAPVKPAITPNKPVSQPYPITPKPEIAKPQFVRRPPVQNENQAVQPNQEDADAYNSMIHANINEAPESDLDHFLGEEIKDAQVLAQIAQTGNVPKILAATVALAVLKKASDIHVEPEEDELRIRFRVDGVLRDVIKMPIELQPALISRIKILSRLKIDEQRIPQDGRFDVKTHGHEIDIRVSTLPTVRGEKAALRLLDKTQNIYSFEQLGIKGHNLKVLEENIIKPYGVILATGPTGSGKSTTLYSILKKISSPSVNVITLEDPVEYEIPGINQCQVKPKIGFSFAEGLRSVLRQDPNIIMVGEIRDSETAGMATHAALTGHLVLSTLHTNDSAGALPRLINMGIEPFLITSSVNVIVAQRLVRKLCQKCKKEVALPEVFRIDIEKELAKFNLQKPYKFYEGQGCSECDHGYSGRMGIYEVLSMSDKIEELAIKKRPASEIAHQAVAEGMITLKQDGLIKAIKGETTVGEVLRVTTSS
ncbi:TPA: hypothetical protein DD449_02210 [Candidatus Berkelbacteria bacterium]|nr:hypothetical protein [Candidatus Berkelbacteria bacterium]